MNVCWSRCTECSVGGISGTLLTDVSAPDAVIGVERDDPESCCTSRFRIAVLSLEPAGPHSCLADVMLFSLS